MPVQRRFKNALKSIAIRSRFHLLLRPFRGPMMFLVYVEQVVGWSLRAWSRNRDAVFRTRVQLYEWIQEEKVRGAPIDYLEFGVWTGNSFRWWLAANSHPESRFVGFDTFTGLPESWGYYTEHHFDTEGKPPDVDDPRAAFEVGLFQHTLGAFLASRPPTRKLVVNIDADLYSATLFVLTSLAPHLKKGDVIIFDEFLAWRTPTDQYRALMDFVAAYYVKYRFAGAGRNFEKLAVEIVDVCTDAGGLSW